MNTTMIREILLALAVSLLLNGILFAIAYRRRSDKLTDISYALSFLAIDFIGFLGAKEFDAYHWILYLMVAIWAVRIGAFLLIRVLTVGKDKRFDGIREDFMKFGSFWLGQAITAWVMLLPVVLAQKQNASLSPLAVAGIVLWLTGLSIETVADYQKFAFKRKGKKVTPWIQSGIWKYSRHPNYFGEIVVWVGVYVFCFAALDTPGRLVGLTSPALITFVLLFVSGIPPLEKSNDKRWGKRPEYLEYKRRTSILIPLPRSK